MWIYASKATLRLSLGIILLVYMLIACSFYIAQNKGLFPGGNIALPKLFWLSTVILCWYILPLLLSFDKQFTQARTVLNIFFLNMLLRAIVELTMMFYTYNWHPYYGIGHDIFTLFLSLSLANKIRDTTDIIPNYLVIMALLFAIETGFAWYMLHNVQHVSNVVYYVPAGNSHQLILGITSAVVMLMVAYLIFFIRKWLYEPVKS